eukprot:5143700-Amphidinium_carterae.1
MGGIMGHLFGGPTPVLRVHTQVPEQHAHAAVLIATTCDWRQRSPCLENGCRLFGGCNISSFVAPPNLQNLRNQCAHDLRKQWTGKAGAIGVPGLTSPSTSSMSLSPAVFASGQHGGSSSQRSSSTPSVRSSLSSAVARRLSINGTSGMSGVKRSTDGRVFTVEKMPADHSCGFHGLGVTREEASRLLRKNRLDHEVVDFVASDLAAAVQGLANSGGSEWLKH